MKYVVEMGSSAMIYIQIFIVSNIKKIDAGCGQHRHTDSTVIA
jgi:hypothetical protein